jgi:hypothetical protein
VVHGFRDIAGHGICIAQGSPGPFLSVTLASVLIPAPHFPGVGVFQHGSDCGPASPPGLLFGFSLRSPSDPPR